MHTVHAKPNCQNAISFSNYTATPSSLLFSMGLMSHACTLESFFLEGRYHNKHSFPFKPLILDTEEDEIFPSKINPNTVMTHLGQNITLQLFSICLLAQVGV